MKKTIPILLLVLFFVAAAWYSLTREPDPVHEIPPPSVVLEPVVEEDSPEPWPEEPVPDETPPPPLPLLHESDKWINQELAVITGPGIPAQYLVKDQVISRLVATIDALTSRQVPAPINPIKGPEGKFIVSTEGETIRISADNSTRYEVYASLLQQMDSTALSGVYKHYYSLFQKAWENNAGEGLFNDRLLEVIDHLLATPDVAGDIYLVKPEAVYLYEDPELEALSAGQKVLLRMGPDNAAVVKAKLVEIRTQVSTD